MENMEKKSFEFIRELVIAERYKKFKKEIWNGADVIFVTSNALDKKRDRSTLREQLNDWVNDSHLLVETEYASAVIWLIETLKPYVNIDYLSKYEYYRNIGICVRDNTTIVKDEKELLLKILDDERVYHFEKKSLKELDKKRPEENEYVRSISKFNWEEWYNFGVENNNPFFMKFMTLWIAFNQIYSKFPGEVPNKDNKGTHHDERKQIIECLENDEKTPLLTEKLFNDIFNSPFIQIFKDEPVLKYNREQGIFSSDKYTEENNRLVKDESEDWRKRIEALFMMMYQVRCNLFHGSKKTSEPRDVKLVLYSGEILEMYLEGTSDRLGIEYSMVWGKDN